MADKKRLIDANALSDKVDESKHDNPHPQGMIRVNHRNEHDHFLRMIMDAPTVDAVEVVHGRWAALDDDCEEMEGEEEAMRWGCTACREIVEYNDWTHRSRLTRYCPNCGAKMEGDGNDNA